MKNLITALMQLVILIVALVITSFAIPKVIGDDNRFDKYIADGSKQTVTVASALDLVKDGETAKYTDMSGEPEKICSKVTFLQKPAEKVLNRQISFKQAKYVSCYWITAIIAGVLCWIFAAGFPFRIGRKGKNVFGAVYNKFSNVVLMEDRRTFEEFEVDMGMTIWGPLWIILLALRMTCAIIWGLILPLVIIANVILGLLLIIGRTVVISIRGAADETKRLSRAKQTDKVTFSLYPMGRYFRIEQDQDHSRGLAARNYWNAVAVKRIFECEAENRKFADDDAEDYLRYGDTDKQKFYETYRLLNRIKNTFNAETKDKNALIAAAYKEDGYEYRFIYETNMYHVFMVGGEKADKLCHAEFASDFNTALLLDVLEHDRNGTMYTENDYKNLYFADGDEFRAKIMNYQENLIKEFGRNRYDEYFEKHKTDIIERRRAKKLAHLTSVEDDDN